MFGVQPSAASTREHTVTIEPEIKHQRIEGWGTCLAGWIDDARELYTTDAWRTAYVEAGCNLLRVQMDQRVIDPGCGTDPVEFTGNVEADAARLNFDQERVKPFVTFADWLKDNALEPDRVMITGSPWTPPHWMKNSTNCGDEMPYCAEFGGDSIGGRLAQENADEDEIRTQFARYFAAWVYGFKDRAGIPISQASLQNESTFENPFDSCAYDVDVNCEEAYWQWTRALRAVYEELVGNGQFPETKLMGPHHMQVGESPDNPWGLLDQTQFIQDLLDNDPELLDALVAFNNNGRIPESSGGAQCWDGYRSGIDDVDADWADWGFPEIMHDGVGDLGKQTWVSEGDGVEPENAMAYSVRMHNALVMGQVSAYVSWQMSDGDEEEHHDILLGTNNVDEPHGSLKYCNFKHFARFIRPGARRVEATFDDGNTTVLGENRWDADSGLSVSAFEHAEDDRTTLVLINRTDSPQHVTLEGLPVASLERFQTESDDDIGFNELDDVPVSGGSTSVTVPAASITTLTGSGSISDGRERYDPLPEERGQFLGPTSGRGPQYTGPPITKSEHVAAGCDDENAPDWFEDYWCDDRGQR